MDVSFLLAPAWEGMNKSVETVEGQCYVVEAFGWKAHFLLGRAQASISDDDDGSGGEALSPTYLPCLPAPYHGGSPYLPGGERGGEWEGIPWRQPHYHPAQPSFLTPPSLSSLPTKQREEEWKLT